MTRIVTNREEEPRGREEKNFFSCVYVFLSTVELCHVVMVKSAIKKSRRKSQREAARVQKQTDAALAMEEEEEIVFKRPRTIPNTPRASRANTPDPDDREEEPRDYTAVLQMVKTVRDQLTALVLDNTNIRAACDDLRRQCHSQGVAFGDLSRLVSQTREDQEETRAYFSSPATSFRLMRGRNLRKQSSHRKDRRSFRCPNARIHYIMRTLLCISQEQDTGF